MHITRIVGVQLYFLPVTTRVPLKFGPETLTSVTCARVALTVADDRGREAEGWGETPLSVQWVWPGSEPYSRRHQALKDFCLQLARSWIGFTHHGHALELGHAFQQDALRPNWEQFNRRTNIPARPGAEPEAMPWLAALVCNSPFDLALHDAFGKLAGRPVYETYAGDFLRADLAHYLQPAPGSAVSFQGKFPADFMVADPPRQLRAWHLVGGLDPVDPAELTGQEPNDGYPVLLADWIERDGLQCLKVKLRGNDSQWDYARLAKVGSVALPKGVEWLTADFNCTVQEPKYVNDILDRLQRDLPAIYDRLLYVEQPFPYELEAHPIDVHSVSARKPLFLDESAHDWRRVSLGRKLGWTGVALKTCKTQTGALLSACWAKAHGMALMVQDLTNPMLAQVPHVLLAARVGTIMGVETNAMQFYPAASEPEAQVHPGLYRRVRGNIDLSTISGPGFGYRLEEIQRELPAPAVSLGG